MKPLPRLQDMPDLIKRRISTHLHSYLDKMSLINCSPRFKLALDPPKFHAQTLKVEFHERDVIQLEFEEDADNSLIRKYSDKMRGCVVVTGKQELFWQAGYLYLVIRDIKLIVENPNLTLKRFHLLIEPKSANEWYDTDRRKFLSELQRVLISSKLKASEFKMRYAGGQEEVLRVLPHLDSDFLEILKLDDQGEAGKSQVDKIFELEHLKPKMKLEMSDAPGLEIEKWWNWPETAMHLRFTKIEDLPRLITHFRTSPDFEQCEMYTEFEDEDILNKMGEDGLMRIYDSSFEVNLPETGLEREVTVIIESGYIEIYIPYQD